MLNEYNENVKQTKERVEYAIVNIQGNVELFRDYEIEETGKNLETLYQEFLNNFKIWETSTEVKAKSAIFEETRKLAEQSAESTEVIDRMLATLRSNIIHANDKSNIVKNAVTIQVEKVVETKDKYMTIVHSVDKIKNEIEVLNLLCDEMEKSRLSVEDMVPSLAAIAQENAAGTEETSATTEEVMATMYTLSEIGDNTSKLSWDLSEIIGKFKLNK